MDVDLVDDLLNDEGGSGMIDPITGESYNPLNDFEEFKDTTVIKDTNSNEKESGYFEVPVNIMDDDIIDDTVNDLGVDNLILDLLKTKGINPDSIKVYDEDNQIQEIAFKDLSNDEKLELLKYNGDDNNDLDDNELEAVQFLRQNNMTLKELAQVIKDKTIEEINQLSLNFEVDEFSDDELFLVDFKNKYGDDFSDDELLTALDKAKENASLYEKQINKIREEYKTYETQLKEDEIKQKELATLQEHEQYVNEIVTIAKSLNDLHDIIDLDDEDKEDILSFMFDKTATGESLFDKSIKNPETRYKAAWYVKNGDLAFKEINNYYKNEIFKLQKELSKYTNLNNKPEAVIKEFKKNTTQPPIRKLEDLL